MSNFDRLTELLPFATDKQREYVSALQQTGGIKSAAKLLGKHHSTIQESLRSLEKRAALRGVTTNIGSQPLPVRDPFILKGQSTMSRLDPVTGERTPLLVWDKTRIDDLQWIEAVKEGVAAFIADQDPLVLPPRAPRNDQVNTDIIPWINIGDAHLGMLAHEAETGANFDLKIAERELSVAVAHLIDELPLVERLVVNDLGDFTHYENMEGVTQASGNALDYDGRFPKMIKVYSRLMRQIIDLALTKAQHVDVIVNQGNHSRTNDIWMAELLRVAYGETGRVHVLNNDDVFIGYRMGRTFVMTHHSDKAKPHRLASVMATDFRRDWGEADYCYIDIGHIHHNMVSKEHPGVQIESFNILAPKDKWAHEGGYRARQSITMIMRSRTYGEIGRRVLPIREVQDRIRASAHGDQAYFPPEKRAFSV
jgi:hypothetical protein